MIPRRARALALQSSPCFHEGQVSQIAADSSWTGALSEVGCERCNLVACSPTMRYECPNFPAVWCPHAKL